MHGIQRPIIHGTDISDFKVGISLIVIVISFVYIPIDVLQRRLPLLVELIQPSELLEVPRLVERAQEHVEPLRLVRVEHLWRASRPATHRSQ